MTSRFAESLVTKVVLFALVPPGLDAGRGVLVANGEVLAVGPARVLEDTVAAVQVVAREFGECLVPGDGLGLVLGAVGVGAVEHGGLEAIVLAPLGFVGWECSGHGDCDDC